MGGGLHQRWWGDLCQPHEAQNGVVSYQLSPFRQNAFHGFFKKGFKNQIRKIRRHGPLIVPPVVIGYYIWTKATELNAFYHTKEAAKLGYGGGH